mgnify:FL=1
MNVAYLDITCLDSYCVLYYGYIADEPCPEYKSICNLKNSNIAKLQTTVIDQK